MNILLIPLASMGMSTLDTKVIELLENIDIVSQNIEQSFNLTGMAMALGLVLALIAGAAECFMMILGQRTLDTMRLLRIIGMSICIANAGTIADIVTSPGLALEKGARDVALKSNIEITALENDMAEAHKKYVEELSSAIDEATEVEKTAEKTKDSFFENVASTVSNAAGTAVNPIGTGLSVLWDYVEGWMKKKTILTEQKIVEWINALIRFLGEFFFQISYIAMLLSQRIFLQILKIFAPVLFALSLAPPFKSAWSQWLGKIVSVSLWGFLIYFILCYVLSMQIFFMNQDLESYAALNNGGIHIDNSGWGGVMAMGMQGIGTTCYLAIGWFIGVYILRFVPEVASWLIPGGVSSGVGSSSAAATGMAASAGGAVGGAIGGAAGSAASGAIKVAGGVASGASVGESAIAQTGIAQHLTAGAAAVRQARNIKPKKKE